LSLLKDIGNTLSLQGAAMHRSARLLSFLLASVSAIAPAWGQTPDRATRMRGARQGAKPGEIITAPDLSERWRDQLQVGEAAPDFTLPLASGTEDAKAMAKRGNQDADGKRHATKAKETKKTVSLKDLRARKPVVLIFGSITCPPFLRALGEIDDVYRDFRDRAEFLFVYIREAHPDSVLSLVDGQRIASLTKIPQATTSEERTEAAAFCGRTLKLTMPIVVDSIENKVGRAYAGWPNRMVVVGTSGNVVYATSPSPRGTDAGRLRDWLKENLKD
jgi:Iodothyronine deiodinase